MNCSKCSEEFPEAEIQLSHDVPKYIGGLDSDGRHYVCKKCHDIYEKTCFAMMVKGEDEITRNRMRKRAMLFAKRYFRGGEDGTNTRTITR